MHHINKICCCFFLIFKSLLSILNNESSDCTACQCWPIGPVGLVLYHSTFISFGEASSYWSVQFFHFYFSFVTILVVNLPELTKTGLITRLDKTVRAEHSCNSLLGHFVLLRLASHN